jgi:hypothetical protein
MSKPKRPVAVTILAILEVILAALALLGIIATWLGLRHIRWNVGSLTIVLLMLAAVELALGFGFLTGKGWAWIGGILFGVLGTAISVFSLYFRPRFGGIIYLAVDLAVIYYLMQPRVRQYFYRNAKVGK